MIPKRGSILTQRRKNRAKRVGRCLFPLFKMLAFYFVQFIAMLYVVWLLVGFPWSVKMFSQSHFLGLPWWTIYFPCCERIYLWKIYPFLFAFSWSFFLIICFKIIYIYILVWLVWQCNIVHTLSLSTSTFSNQHLYSYHIFESDYLSSYCTCLKFIEAFVVSKGINSSIHLYYIILFSVVAGVAYTSIVCLWDYMKFWSFISSADSHCIGFRLCFWIIDRRKVSFGCSHWPMVNIWLIQYGSYKMLMVLVYVSKICSKLLWSELRIQ